MSGSSDSSRMSGMGVLVWASIKMLFRNRQSVFWALAFPLIFVVVFGLFNFEKTPAMRVAVVGARAAPTTEAIVAGLKQAGPFTISEPTSLAAARSQLSADKLDLVVIAPAEASAGASVPVELLYNQGNVQTNQIAIGLVQRVIDGMNLRIAGLTSPPLVLKPTPVSARTVHYYDWLLPGLVAMGVMQYSLTGIAVAMATLRQRGVLNQILATPLRPVKFLAAQVIAYLLLTTAQTAVILGVGMIAFHGHVYGNLGWVFFLAFLGNIIFLCLGLAVAGRAPNPEAAQGIGMVVAMPMMFLSGVFFAADTLPKVLQKLFAYLPLAPLIDALRKVANDGLSISATGSQLGLLGIWLVAAFALASLTFRFAKR